MTLKTIALDDRSITVEGALDVQRKADRIRVRRLPGWTQTQSPEPAFDLMVAMGAGVRLCFTTDSDTIELDVLITGLQFAGEPRRPAIFDVCVAGARLSREAPTAGHTIIVDGASVRFEAGAPCTVRFNGLGDDLKQIELFLPQSAMTEILALRVTSTAHMAAHTRAAFRWAHYGSSISHGMEASGPSETWPAIVAEKTGVDLTNLGFAGQCHLDGFVARSLRDGEFDAISMKIGANIVASDSLRRRTFASAVHTTLDTIRDRNPETPLMIMSPIHCPLLEGTPGPLRRLRGGGYVRLNREAALEDGALTLMAAREILKDVVARRCAAGDVNLHHLDGTSLIGPADTTLMPDQLHPDANGHRLMAARFAAVVSNGAGPLGSFFDAPRARI